MQYFRSGFGRRSNELPPIGTARGILRNTAAQVLLGVLDKGAGLLVAAAAWTVAIASLRILPRHELRFMKEFVTGRGKRHEQPTAD